MLGNIESRVATGSTVYTDEHKGYKGLSSLYEDDTVRHSAGEYVRGDTHTNGIEGFWSILKRAHYGIYHVWSRKHLHRYVSEISGRQGLQDIPAFDHSDGSGITMIRILMAGMVGHRLTYAELANA